MIHRTISVLAELKKDTEQCQFSVVPLEDGGAALILGFDVRGKRHEVNASFTKLELAVGTEHQLATTLETQIAEAMLLLDQARGRNMTREQILARIRQAAEQAPAHLATSAIARASELVVGDGTDC